MDDEFGDFLQKRVRNLQKRMRRLQQYEEMVAENPDSLNEDQLAALAKKDEVEVPLKVQQGLLEAYLAIVAKQTESFSKKEIIAAEERGAAKEREKLALTLKFLHTVAALHQTSDAEPSPEIGPLATLLQQLYTGDERALSAVDKLHAGSANDKIGGLTFERIRALADGTAEPIKAEVSFTGERAAPSSESNGEAKPNGATGAPTAATEAKPVNGDAAPNGQATRRVKRRPRKANGKSQ